MIFSADVIAKVIEVNKDINTIRFFSFSTSTKLQDRLTDLSDVELNIIQKAKAKKYKDGTRFWDAMLSLFAEEAINERILSEAFFHQANADYLYVARNKLNQFFMRRGDIPLAINSKVILNDGTSRHIPLLDFKLSADKYHDNLAKACVQAMGLEGYLLNSGRSYHFIGVNLISESDLINLLAKFSLLSPLSDKAWVSHQIIERSASLRVTAKDGKEPVLVCEC